MASSADSALGHTWTTPGSASWLQASRISDQSSNINTEPCRPLEYHSQEKQGRGPANSVMRKIAIWFNFVVFGFLV